ncbi:hypothetical protein ABFS83_08G003700 [Erythranthe nasuta]
MSENSRDLTASGESINVGPDFFGYYASEVAQLLSQDECLFPFPHPVTHLAGNLHEVVGEKVSTESGCRNKKYVGIKGSAPLFSTGIGALLSDFKKERLKILVRQGVFTLTQEVDEMIDPIISFCRLQSSLRCKDTLLGLDASTCKADQPQHPPHKRLKVLPAFSDSEGEHMSVALPEKESSNDVLKKCIHCQTTSAPDGTKSICHACGLSYAKNLENVSSMNSDTEAGKTSRDVEIDDDLRILLENDSAVVEELMKKHFDEFSGTLHHMEQKLEELLNNLMTSCRPMTITEKQRLRKLIQNLPPTNLERVVEIIGHSKLSEGDSCDQVHVDLDEEEVTLWRLYFYVTTVQGSITL